MNLAKTKKIILTRSECNLQLPFFKEINLENLSKPIPSGLYQITKDCLNKTEGKNIHLGKPSIESGKVSFYSFHLAVQIQKQIGGNLITLPLSKEWVIKSGVRNFRGHTEELSMLYKKPTTMLMYGPTMKVIVLTTHIPLRKVSLELKKIDVLSLINSIKNSTIFQNPKIALCGLNPHAGEDGKIGTEEKEVLLKIVEKFRTNRMNISEPMPADSLFQSDIRSKYDLILACYHDQGLIPFKSIEGKKGINVTLGLDFLRVSPDHGTAFDIAGKGNADPTSFWECLNFTAKN
ncbi:MAG: 4-hydroxythreonine-4-phosphate dehydrogenase PdxA [Leptospiraceae bacterium]|nr:4-hydroxythreonine-4-phosphate dehydrogenase PdxA [Leptospiraceae bacterium]NUM42051.1 4-hydroxythreonine-4-phosphate dehydrogenase PdxA [Leptospiraceae bacterium]